MSYEKVKRNQYYDPPSEYPHSSRNHAEDTNEFHLPLHRMHNINLHDWGIARGLEVSGALGATEVVIQPGVAIDGSGQLISLSTLGHGDIGMDPPGGDNQETTVPVSLSLAAQAGKTVYVTVQYSEILRVAEGSGGRREQVPWVRLQPAAGAGAYADDGNAVILAVVQINAAGQLTSLAASQAGETYRRRLLGQSLEELRVQRATKVGNQVQESTSGKIGPGASGGLMMTVPNSGDSITLQREGGGNFDQVAVRANSLAVKDSGGRDALYLNSGDARLTVGSSGLEGDLEVKDANGQVVLGFNGSSAALSLGASNNAGDIYIKDSSGSNNVAIYGSTGELKVQNIDPYGNVLDVNARFVRLHGWDLCLDGRSGGNKRALVDYTEKLIINFANDYRNGVETPGNFRVQGNLYAGDRLVKGNPARYVTSRFLFADDGTATEEVDLGSSRQFAAFVSIIGMDPRHDFDQGDAFAVDIFSVDGVMTPWHFRGGAHFGPADSPANIRAPFFRGVGQRILFRARSFQDASVLAIGVVFYE